VIFKAKAATPVSQARATLEEMDTGVAPADLALAICRLEPDFTLDLEESPGHRSSYGLKFWESAEEGDILRCYLVVRSWRGRRRLEYLVAEEGFENRLNEAMAAAIDAQSAPSLATRIADLIFHAEVALEESEEILGQMILWSKLSP